MDILSQIQKALEGWSTWKRLLRAADKVDELERQIAELRADKAAGPPREDCPKCGERRLIITGSAPDPLFADLGATRRSYRCTACGLTEERLIE